MFGIAFVCAGIAAFLVRGMINASNSGEGVTVVHGAPPASKRIVVAAKDLKPGDTITKDGLREIDWGGETLPKGAFTTMDAILKSGGSHMVAAFVAENEPIVLGKLYDPQGSTLAGRMKDGMTGVTIHVNDASGVGGFAQPEDRVDVLMTQTEREGTGTKAYAVILLRHIRVLAVDQQTQRKQLAQPPKTVTLEVSPENAKKLNLAQAIGQLSLALTKGTSGTDDGGVIDINDLLQRQTVPQAPVVTPAAIEIEPIVTVTRSTERKEYQVPEEARH